MRSPHCPPDGFSPPLPVELQAQYCAENTVIVPPGTVNTVPEPASIGLVGLAVIIMMYFLRSKV